MIRTAECFAFRRVVLAGISARVNEAKVRRAALGAEQFMDVRRMAGADEYLPWLNRQKAKMPLIGLETSERAVDLETYTPRLPAVFLFGNEEFGLSECLTSLCDVMLAVPLAGIKNSLNVGHCLAVVAYYIHQRVLSQANPQSNAQSS